ncbi:amidohydrolase family protein [Novosphingobium sp. RL4]|uniref:amidohydrolase family protein n=1 Tax=Novosphingobium sp. RL4 TaxID=3109595 RepID=UPI002D790255|nr:amidohydrolase family protein [Novosphingobium sp. RL4]WRT94434.1 amidohydrolase family protein [Novosphingobium sp. RL4]
MAERTIIRGATIVSMDPTIGDFPRGDILVEHGKIRAIGSDLGPMDAQVLDADGMIAMPGFVDTHRHIWQSCMRYSCVDCSAQAYFEDMLFTRGGGYTPEDVRIGTLMGTLSAIESGITTLLDWSHIQNSPEHTDASIAALRESGMRAVFAHGWPLVEPAAWMVESDRAHPQDIARLRRDYFASDDGLVTLAMAARGPEMASSSVWKADLELARSLGIRSTIHMGAFPFNGEKSAIAEMQRAGALGEDLTFVHCNCSSDEELTMMADHGITVSLGINVEMNAQGIGDIPLDRLLARGIRPSLSGDTEACGCGDMFTQMRGALGHYRSWMGGGHSREKNAPATLASRDVLEFATIEGARANGLLSKVGTLAVGKSADIILINARHLNLFPMSEPVATVVAGAHPGNVDTVMVEGRILKRGGELVGFDLDGIRQQAAASQERILGRGVDA